MADMIMRDAETMEVWNEARLLEIMGRERRT
jgi:hypothetical protein